MSGSSPTRPRAWPAWLLLLLVAPVAAWVLWQSQRLVRADLLSLADRHQVAAWVAGESAPRSPADLAAAGAAIQRSLAITPDDPAMQERMGDVHFVAARLDWEQVALRRQHLAQARGFYLAALALRPSEPQTWVMLATVYQGMGLPAPQVHAAWARALALGPHEGHVRPMLLQVVLADWDSATPAMQAWAKAMFDQGDAATQRAVNTMAAPYGLVFTPDAATAP